MHAIAPLIIPLTVVLALIAAALWF